MQFKLLLTVDACPVQPAANLVLNTSFLNVCYLVARENSRCGRMAWQQLLHLVGTRAAFQMAANRQPRPCCRAWPLNVTRGVLKRTTTNIGNSSPSSTPSAEPQLTFCDWARCMCDPQPISGPNRPRHTLTTLPLFMARIHPSIVTQVHLSIPLIRHAKGLATTAPPLTPSAPATRGRPVSCHFFCSRVKTSFSSAWDFHDKHITRETQMLQFIYYYMIQHFASLL